MARRRSPHFHPVASSSSSGDFEEGIALMVADPHRRDDRRVKPAHATTSLRASLLRFRSWTNRRPSGSGSRWKWAAACLASAFLVLVLSTRSGHSNGGTHHIRSAGGSEDAGSPYDAGSKEAEAELLEALYGLPLPTTFNELDELNEELKDLDPKFILKWAHRQLIAKEHHLRGAPPLVQVTSFGPTGLVILDLLAKLDMLSDVPVITMDTLHLFPESYRFYDTIRSRYEAMMLDVTKPLLIERPPEMIGDGVVAGSIDNRKEFEAQYGTTLWKTDPQKFAKLTKVEPMEHALARKQAKMWITGRRRSSGGERSDMDVLEFEYFSGVDADPRFDAESPHIDAERGRWKLNPLAYWTYDRVWGYIRKHRLPYNELYDRGYTSLGDVMTTSPPRRNASLTGDAVDDFERSGRFAGMGNRTECGLHAHRKRVKAAKQKALEAGEELSVPALRCDKCLELSNADFEERILGGGGKGGRGELLVEFYSPYCGGCQEFAPTLNRIANHLSLRKPSTKVARFDITENEVPFVKGEELFRVEATPTLYRVRLAPSFGVELYEGGHDFDSIVHWVEHKS